jgi:hypothetical protein
MHKCTQLEMGCTTLWCTQLETVHTTRNGVHNTVVYTTANGVHNILVCTTGNGVHNTVVYATAPQCKCCIHTSEITQCFWFHHRWRANRGRRRARERIQVCGGWCMQLCGVRNKKWCAQLCGVRNFVVTIWPIACCWCRYQGSIPHISAGLFPGL